MLHRAATAGLMAAALIITLSPPKVAAAEDYPTRPLTLIVPYPAGGGVDAMGRIVGQKLSVALGQQVVIENHGGAGGMIGTRDAIKAAPDGYTIVMLLTGISLGVNTGYDINKEFAPIGLVASTPIIVGLEPLLAGELAERRHRFSEEGAGQVRGRHAAVADASITLPPCCSTSWPESTSRWSPQGTGAAHQRSPRRPRPLGFNTIPAAVSNIRASSFARHRGGRRDALGGVAQCADRRRVRGYPDSTRYNITGWRRRPGRRGRSSTGSIRSCAAF